MRIRYLLFGAACIVAAIFLMPNAGAQATLQIDDTQIVFSSQHETNTFPDFDTSGNTIVGCVYTVNPTTSTKLDLKLVKSTDFGATWSTHLILANASTTSAPLYERHCGIAAATTSKYAVAYVDVADVSDTRFSITTSSGTTWTHYLAGTTANKNAHANVIWDGGSVWQVIVGNLDVAGSCGQGAETANDGATWAGVTISGANNCAVITRPIKAPNGDFVMGVTEGASTGDVSTLQKKLAGGGGFGTVYSVSGVTACGRALIAGYSGGSYYTGTHATGGNGDDECFVKSVTGNTGTWVNIGSTQATTNNPFAYPGTTTDSQSVYPGTVVAFPTTNLAAAARLDTNCGALSSSGRPSIAYSFDGGVTNSVVSSVVNPAGSTCTGYASATGIVGRRVIALYHLKDAAGNNQVWIARTDPIPLPLSVSVPDIRNVRTDYTPSLTPNVYVSKSDSVAVLDTAERRTSELVLTTTVNPCDGSGEGFTSGERGLLAVTSDLPAFVFYQCGDLDPSGPSHINIYSSTLDRTNTILVAASESITTGQSDVRTANRYVGLRSLSSAVNRIGIDIADGDSANWEIADPNRRDVALDKIATDDTFFIRPSGTGCGIRLVNTLSGISVFDRLGICGNAITAHDGLVYVGFTDRIERYERTADTLTFQASTTNANTDEEGLLKLTKDGQYLIAGNRGADVVKVLNATSMAVLFTFTIDNPFSFDADLANNYLFVASPGLLTRYELWTQTTSLSGDAGEGTINPVVAPIDNPYSGDQTGFGPGTGGGGITPSPPLGEGAGPLDQIATQIADSWGFSIAAVGIMIALLILTIVIIKAAHISTAPIFLGAVGFLTLGITYYLNLIPIWLLFIIGFLTLAFVTVVLFGGRGGDGDE